MTPEQKAAEEILRQQAEANGDLEWIHPDLRALAVRIELLNFDPTNAEDHDPRNLKTIAQSLIDNGQMSTISCVHKYGDLENVIVKGNGTTTAAKMLEHKWIAATFKEMEGIDAMAYGMTDNRSSKLSKMNYTQTGKNLRQLQEAGHPTFELLYTEEEVLPLMREDFAQPAITDEKFDASMLRGRSISKITASERLIVDQAIEQCRKEKSKALTEGSCLEMICREYLEKRMISTAVQPAPEAVEPPLPVVEEAPADALPLIG